MPIALVAIPAAVIIALVVLMLIWASDPLLRKPLQSILGGLPVIGGQLAGNIDQGIRFLVAFYTSWAAHALGPFVQLLYVPLSSLWDNIASSVTAIEAVAGWVASVAGAAADAINDLQHTAGVVIQRIETNAVKLAGVIADAAATAAKLAHVIASVIPAAVADLRAFVRTLVAQAIDTADVALGRAIDNLHDWTAARIRDATGPISAELAHVGDLVRGLRVDLGSAVGTIMGLLAPILALDLVQAIPRLIARIDTMERECVDPMCSAITPQLPTLSALGDIATMLLVGALVGEAVRDPEGAARAVAGVVDGIHSEADALTAAFAGVHV